MPPTATPTLTPSELVLWLAGEEGVRLAQDTPLLFFQDGTLQTLSSAALPLSAGTLVQLTENAPVPDPRNPAVLLHEVHVLEGDLQGRVGWLPEGVLENAQPLTPWVVCRVEEGCRVRAGDDLNYPVVIALTNGETARVRGVSSRTSSVGGRWLAITTNAGVQGWIAPHVVLLLGDVRRVPVLAPPPSPTPSDTPPPTALTPTEAGG